MGLDHGLHLEKRGPDDKRTFGERELIYWRNQWHILAWFRRWIKVHDPEQYARIQGTGEMACIVVTEELILEFMGEFQADERAMHGMGGMGGTKSVAAALAAIAGGETVVYSESY